MNDNIKTIYLKLLGKAYSKCLKYLYVGNNGRVHYHNISITQTRCMTLAEVLKKEPRRLWVGNPYDYNYKQSIK